MSLADRRSHNHGQLVAFLDEHYPNSAPGSPDPNQVFDDNKKTSRVILKAGAWKRADSALKGKDDRGGVVDRELARSYRLLLDLLDSVPAALDDAESRKKPRKGRKRMRFDDHRLAARFVLMNVNTAGGHEELERIERIGRGGDRAASAVARMCRRVIAGVLDELDERGYWLGWGTDAEDRGRQDAVGARKTEGADADGGAIAMYHDLMARSFSSVDVREYLTAQHFGVSTRTVRRAVKAEPTRRTQASQSVR